ncbi:MAG: ABC transporter permease [Patulibacter sp.]
MSLLAAAFAWLFSAERLTGSHPLPESIGVHLAYTAIAVLIAAVIAIPAGWAIGHTGRGREIVVALSGAVRALPSFGLILLLVLLIGVLHASAAALVAFVILAIPPTLAGAYAGFESIDRRTIDAARAIGMSGWQVLWRVEVPLGLPLLVAGIRSATLQVLATATLAAYVNLGGLGYDILQGIQLRRFDQVLGGAIVVAALALVVDGMFALLQRSLPAPQRSMKRMNNHEDSHDARRRGRRSPDAVTGGLRHE